MNSSNSLWFAVLIGLPLIASPLIYIVGHLRMRRAGRNFTRLSRAAAFMIVAVEWPIFAVVANEFNANGPLTLSLAAINLRLDGVGLLLIPLVLALGTLILLFSGPDMQHENGQDKYYAMFTAMVGTLIGMFCAADLFNLWVWFECMVVTSYLLVAFYRHQADAIESCVKYLVQSEAGSILVLLGIALVLTQTHTLDLNAIHGAASSGSPLLLAAGALFVIGFGIKAALVPLHTWLPDAYSVAPSGISAILSSIVTEAGLIAMLRAIMALSSVSLSWGPVLIAFGALNMLTGNLMALRQTTVKRMLAYSSVSQLGYILLGIGIGLYSGEVSGIQGGLFQLFNHGLMKGLAFLAIGSLIYCFRLADDDHHPLKISELSGAAQRYPIAAFTLAVAVIGLAGLPPLAGFASEWQIFTAGFATQNSIIDGFVIFAALNSVLSLAYYIPLVNTIYGPKQSSAVQTGKRLPISMTLPLITLGVAVAVIGVWPSLLSGLTGTAGQALLRIAGQ
jgi:proton-translocating NADH-quinone oxidoreductase chain N